MPVEPTGTAAAKLPAGIDVRQAPWLRPLVADYAFNFPKIAKLYAGDPASPEAWRQAIARAQKHDIQRPEIVRILEAQQASRGAPAAASDAARTLLDPRSVAVVTGQQAGAFGGPLFTLLKAITTIQLARRVASEHRTPAVAVFWVDAEDHDWEEVSSCTVLDASLQPRAITLAAPEGAGELPVAALTFDGRIESSLDELSSALVQSDFTDWVLTSLRAAYKPGIRVSDAFARWLETILGPYGLIVFESADRSAKQLASQVFSRELREPGRTAALALTAGEALSERGHTPQVMPQPDSVSLFHLDGARRSIKFQGGSFLVGNKTYSARELGEQAATTPERFSPNVLLRPIVQDTLFPTIAYVSGPSELAYLGQLGGVYDHFGVPMPLMYPRAMATLVDSATSRFLGKHDLAFPELQAQDESALNRLLEGQLPKSLEQAMKDAEDAIKTRVERIVAEMPALDPTLVGAARTTAGKMQHELRALHSKMIHAAKKRHETLRRQFTRAQAQAFPHGHPQERTLGGVFFLNRYGPALAERLLESLPLEQGHHWVLTI